MPELLLVVVLVLFIIFLTGFRVAQQYERALVFRFGRFKATRTPGLFWMTSRASNARAVGLTSCAILSPTRK